MAESILETDGVAGSSKDGAKEKGKVVRKEGKSKKSKAKKDKKDRKGKKVKEESESGSDSEQQCEASSSSEDPERIHSSLALQLNLSGNQLKLKGSKVLKVEDLSPDQLQFIIAHPSGCHQNLPELSTFTLFETGGELYQMRRAATTRLQNQLGKKKVNKDLERQTQAEEVCLRSWKKHLLEIYELLEMFNLDWR